MATPTNVQVPTPTPAEWSAFQAAQRSAKAFFLAPDGPAGKSNVKTFQGAFNPAIPALRKIIAAKGGNPDAAFAAVPGGTPIKVDGAYGDQTNRALGMVVLFSFSAANAKPAAGELMTPPAYRNRIAPWAKKWSAEIANMVAQSYSQIVQIPPTSTTPTPAVNTTINNPGVISQPASQDVTKPPSPPATGTNVAPPPGSSQAQKPPTPIDEPAIVVASADTTSYAWIAWLVGAVGLGGALYYFFGRKKARH